MPKSICPLLPALLCLYLCLPLLLSPSFLFPWLYLSLSLHLSLFVCISLYITLTFSQSFSLLISFFPLCFFSLSLCLSLTLLGERLAFAPLCISYFFSLLSPPYFSLSLFPLCVGARFPAACLLFGVCACLWKCVRLCARVPPDGRTDASRVSLFCHSELFLFFLFF